MSRRCSPHPLLQAAYRGTPCRSATWHGNHLLCGRDLHIKSHQKFGPGPGEQVPEVAVNGSHTAVPSPDSRP
jgi:hypothetical protein